MLRSAIFSFIAMAVVMAGFAAYWYYQPAVVVIGSSAGTAPSGEVTTRPSGDSVMQIGSGARAWVESYDEQNRLASRFRAEEYTPQKDGSFKATQPQWIFYLSDNQRLTVTGETGVVFVDSGKGGGNNSDDAMMPTARMPNHGVLHQVHLALFPNDSATKPSLWLDVNNIAFDNDTLRLYTQSFQKDDGTTVPADGVPVTLRGDDYEFDGTGLTLHWNDVDRRLHLLEIAHGGRLQIKNPAKMSMPWSAKTTVASASHAGEGFGGALGEALVSANPAAGGEVIADNQAMEKPRGAKAPSAPSTEAVVEPYRAVFHDNVRVLQGERQIAMAEMLTVDFLQARNKKADHQTGTEPVVGNQLGAGVEGSTSPATTKPSTSGQATTAGSTGGQGDAAAAKNLPITVYWTGKLRVTTLETEPMMPLIPGQAVVRLVGSSSATNATAVVLTPEGSAIHAAAVMYRSDGAVQLENSQQFPRVRLDQDRGTKFSTESFVYDPATSLATMLGPSELTQEKNISATWTKKGVLHFVGKPSQPQGIDHADLLGEVNVRHPQFTQSSEELALDLDKAPARAGDSTKASEGDFGGKGDVVVRRAIASGNVQCRLLRDGQAQVRIDGDRLAMETAPDQDGKSSPRQVNADGNVRVQRYAGNEHIEAGHLIAMLAKSKPAKDAELVDDAAVGGDSAASKPTVAVAQNSDAAELESMHAWSNVHAVMKSGAVADADDLQLTSKDGKPKVTLSGNAKVNDGKVSSITGPTIHIVPDAQSLSVTGPGTMQTVHKNAGETKGQPIRITWADAMALNGAANTVDVRGQVTVHAIDLNGTVNDMAGDFAHLDLVDDKKADPSNADADAEVAAAAAARPATQDTASVLGGKSPKLLTLVGHVHGGSLLSGPDGTVLRRGSLLGERLIYDAQTGKIEVPGAGELSLEDHQGKMLAGDAKATGDAKAGGEAGGGGNKGAMAVRWGKFFRYDGQRQIVIEGDTRVGFMQDQKGAAPMQLDSQTLTVDLVPGAGGGAQPGGAVSHVRAERNVQFVARAKGIQFHAHSVDYDPSTKQLTARGSADEPAYLEDAQGMSSGGFDELLFDTAKQEVVTVKGGRADVQK